MVSQVGNFNSRSPFLENYSKIKSYTTCRYGARVGAEVKVLRYKPKGRGFDFFIDIILPVALGPGVDSASNKNEYQEYFLVVKAVET
jgi:hypothetical protein